MPVVGITSSRRSAGRCSIWKVSDSRIWCGYLMTAYGVVNGEACAERPQMIIADGRRRPVLDLRGRPIPGVPAGAMTFGRRPDPQTLELGSDVDGQELVAGRYEVSADGKTLTVTNKGSGPQGGPFEVVMVLE